MPDALLITISLGLLAALVFTLVSSCRKQKELLARLDKQSSTATERQDSVVTEARQLLDALQLGIFIISPKGRIERTNHKARRIFGDRDLEDRSIEEVFLASQLITATRETLNNRTPIERLITLPSGTLASDNNEETGDSHWNAEFTPVDPDNPNSNILLTLRDVSKDIRADQIRKDFVANASHELRTPLTIIGGYIENLLEDDILSEPEATQHMLGIMRKHVNRINRIVEDMLVISRLESGESSPLKIAPFPVEDCINDVVKRLESLIQQQKATVDIHLPNPDLTMEGDRFYWVQILFNLVENALKQNASQPVKITVSATESEDKQILLEVTDNGIGIPSSDLPFIFKRFFRVEKHHSQGEVKGTGLGLSIVKRAIEAHGGSITATSTPGVETCFSITVPLQTTVETQE